MREPNKAILRERHNMPTLDELIHDLNGATVFSKLDLSSGYHQLELHPSSRYITKFRTHNGLCRYKILNFGISSASEIFQEHIRKVISHIAPTKNISDDIIIYGKGENVQAIHDRTLAETIEALHTNRHALNLAPNYHVHQQKTTMTTEQFMPQHEKTTNRQNSAKRRMPTK